MVSNLKKALENVETVATTADAWSKMKRAYLGMTIHWIDANTLERKTAALAVRRIVGRQTYSVLASEIDKIHKEFGVQNKASRF